MSLQDLNTQSNDASGDGGNNRNHPSKIPRTNDAAIKTELDHMELSHSSYSRTPFNPSTLRFSGYPQPESGLISYDVPLDLDILLKYLSPSSLSAKQFEYRAEGYKALLASLRGLQCSSGPLEFRRVDLINTVSAELGSLLAAATQELKTQASAGTHYDGLRRIHFDDPTYQQYWSPVVLAVIVLVALIHCILGVSREGCGFILKCIQFILRLAASLQNSRSAESFISNHVDPIPTTLPTVLQHLGLQDSVDFYAVCPKCDALYKEDDIIDVPDSCNDSNHTGVRCGAELFAERYRGNRNWTKPVRQFSHEPFERWLARFLLRHDVEDMLDIKPSLGQELCTDVWGAWYMSNFPGRGQPYFFDCPPNKLRLAFLVYHDFFNPYTNKIAGKKRSVGLIMMVCLNLPPDVRYDMKNIYVTAMLPSPKEPTLDNLNKFLRPIVDNLCEHYHPGVYISKTHRHPRGRKVRSAVTISSLDIVASRAFSGLGSHSHTCCCSFCNATLSEIDDFNLANFCERSFEDYFYHVERWKNATSLEERAKLWSQYGVRYTEWSRLPWYNPFTDTTIAPLHWIKNSLEKLIRENMGCSTTVHAGIPSVPPPLSRLLTTVELKWGLLAMLHLDEPAFSKSGLPELLLRFLCRDKRIFEAGLNSTRMIKDLNVWRRKNHLVQRDGTAANLGPDNAVAVAKAEYFLSCAGREVTSSLDTHSTMPVLQALCNEFEISWKSNDRKAELMKKLVKHYSKNVPIVPVPLPEPPEGEGPLLGLEVVAEIKADMQRTNLPNWLKRPPLNFATTDHGKLASKEYKSLSLVLLPITLIRLWNSNPELRQYLDHFLQLSVTVRILSYQSLTDRDKTLFWEHYQQYVDQLKSLYPYNSITPVQHLGLHIPYFLDKLGPSTRYSENTCEMFIGMLEDISTNSRIGELEQTLHRELIMAANLSAMINKRNFSETLGPLADIIGKFLDKRYNSSGQQLSVAWSTKHKRDPMTLDQATHDALSSWAEKNQTRGFARRLYVCDELSRGHVVYQPFTDARNNSGILFRPRGVFTAVAGRVEAILQESNDVGAPRIIILARNFVPLSVEDAAQDPYRNHPVVGIAHLDIMRLYYDAVDVENMHIIEPEDIISHIAVCSFADPHHTISAPSAIVVDLDMKHHFHL